MARSLTTHAVVRIDMAAEAAAVDALMGEWLSYVVDIRRARRDLLVAIGKMPWWAQPGPSLLHSDGSMSGTVSWQPAIQDLALPEGSVMRSIRPSETDFERFHLRSPFGTEAFRRQRCDAAVAKLKERRAAQKVEMKRAGVTAAMIISDALRMRSWRIEHAIRDRRPSPYRLAANSIFAVTSEACGDVCFAKQAEVTKSLRMHDVGNTLRDLIPILPPIMAATAARIIKPGAGPVSKMPVWWGESELLRKQSFGLMPIVRSDEAETAAERIAA